MVRKLASEKKKRSAIRVVEKMRSLVSSPGSSSSSSSSTSGQTSSNGNLVDNYANFRASGEPARFLFFHGGRWSDFHPQTFQILKKAFIARSVMTEVCSGSGGVSLVDFLRMTELDSETGRQRSVAWIDVDGRCFFPKVTIDDHIVRSDHSKVVSDKLPVTDSTSSPAPKVEIEIRIRKAGDHEIKTKIVEEAQLNDMLEEECGDNIGMKIDGGDEWPNAVRLKEEEGKANYSTIQSMFLASFKDSVTNPVIVGMYKCLHCGRFGKSRLQAFVKRIELVKSSGKVPNVRFAWYSSSLNEIKSILAQGFEQPMLKAKLASNYGVGVHLLPLNSLHHSSLSLMEGDEKGERHVILCRVMLGEMERIEAGSEQFEPSSDEYESGVDDLQNPRFYVVWSKNMNQTILPEFIVSFKSSYHQPGKNQEKQQQQHLVGICLSQNYLKKSENSFLPPDYKRYKASTINTRLTRLAKMSSLSK